MKYRAWIVVAILVFAGVWLGTRRSGGQVASAQTPKPSDLPSPVDPDLPRLPFKMVNVSESVKARAAEAAKMLAGKQSAANAESFDGVPGTDWAVVVAIYRQYEAAEQRARSLDDLDGIRPTVFPDKGQGSKYMVVLGSGLTRSKAEALRDRAVSAQMPSDTYVTRLSR